MLPGRWAAAPAAPVGGGWYDGNGSGSGSGCTSYCSRNSAAAAASTSAGPSSIAPRTRRPRGKKTGPNPTDRRKAGSKHHLITDARGVPLSRGDRRPTSTTSRSSFRSSPPCPPCAAAAAGPAADPDDPGRSGYDSSPIAIASAPGIVPILARRRTPHGSGSGIVGGWSNARMPGSIAFAASPSATNVARGPSGVPDPRLRPHLLELSQSEEASVLKRALRAFRKSARNMKTSWYHRTQSIFGVRVQEGCRQADPNRDLRRPAGGNQPISMIG